MGIWKRHIATPLALTLTALALPAAAGAETSSTPCDSAPLLARYQSAGLAQRDDQGQWQLALVADLHSADCGAPDCYGTRLAVSLQTNATSEACLVSGADIMAEEYAEENCGPPMPRPPAASYHFRTTAPAADLASPETTEVTLMSDDGTRALLLLPENFFYFDEVEPGGTLHRSLFAGDEGDTGCCWGASASRVWFPSPETATE